MSADISHRLTVTASPVRSQPYTDVSGRLSDAICDNSSSSSSTQIHTANMQSF